MTVTSDGTYGPDVHDWGGLGPNVLSMWSILREIALTTIIVLRQMAIIYCGPDQTNVLCELCCTLYWFTTWGRVRDHIPIAENVE